MKYVTFCRVLNTYSLIILTRNKYCLFVSLFFNFIKLICFLNVPANQLAHVCVVHFEPPYLAPLSFALNTPDVLFCSPHTDDVRRCPFHLYASSRPLESHKSCCSLGYVTELKWAPLRGCPQLKCTSNAFKITQQTTIEHGGHCGQQ